MANTIIGKQSVGEVSNFIAPTVKIKTREAGNLFEIGKPSAYHETVDPEHRIGKYLRAKMNLIDLIPCDYTLDLSSTQKTDNGVTGMLPQINYEPIEDFKTQCAYYGLKPHEGIRIYTTDDTNVSDSISNQLQDNYMQQAVNKLSNFGQNIRQFSQSVGLNQLREALQQKAKGSLSDLSQNQNVDETAEQNIQSLLDTTVNVIASGHRLSFPKVWSETNYNPNFQAQIKLVSPYGHPKAVKEFITKPLMYLILMGSPITNDGVSYGRPYFVSVDAYGLGHTPIGVISNITLRRGGNDTSFNIHRQPLTIDVSLEIQFLVSGFASFSGQQGSRGIGPSESNTFNNADRPVTESQVQGSASIPTLGSMIRSLRPVSPETEHRAHTNFSRAHNWGGEMDSSDYANISYQETGQASQIAEMGLHPTSPATSQEVVASEDIESGPSRNLASNIGSTSNNNSNDPIA